jgi:20S proteasome alpha/beta subunit
MMTLTMRVARLQQQGRRFIFILAVLLLVNVEEVEGAHSRRRRVASSQGSRGAAYDRSVTVFSPEGRLLQVEYARSAAGERGGTVAAYQDDDVVCVALVSGGEGSSPSLLERVHRLEDHALWIGSGLSGDARVLGDAVRLEARRARLSLGEPLTIRELAYACAEMQHEWTRSPGGRPFAVRGLLLGVDFTNSVPKLYLTEPGGSVERRSYCACGPHESNILKSLRQLEEDLEKKSSSTGTLTPTDSIAEDANNERKRQLGDLVYGVAKASLSTYDSDVNNPDEIKKWVDVIVLQADASRRGGVRIRYARNIQPEDLARLKDVF